eukprot:COSAG01_NODE_15796_length_1299_cov_0.648333_1_plen_27_part_10
MTEGAIDEFEIVRVADYDVARGEHIVV